MSLSRVSNCVVPFASAPGPDDADSISRATIENSRSWFVIARARSFRAAAPAMNAVDRTKSGAASGVVSMSRMVGGSVGLAVMGALVTTIGRSKLDSSLPQLPPAARAQLANALGSSAAPRGHASPYVVHALHNAFVSALAAGLKVGAVVAFVGAVFALWLINPVRTQPAETRPREQRAAEAATA
jgi:hypothetical protein